MPVNPYVLYGIFFILGLLVCYLFAYITKKYIDTFFLFAIKNIMGPKSENAQKIEAFISKRTMNDYFIFYIVWFLLIVLIKFNL